MLSGWYDPQARRFISEDPIGFGGGLNQYAFGGNDPVNKIDPSGTNEAPYCAIVMDPGCMAEAGLSYDILMNFLDMWHSFRVEQEALLAPQKREPSDVVGPPGPLKTPVLVSTYGSCSDAEFQGGSGTIVIQISPKTGILFWRIRMEDSMADYGYWNVNVYVNGSRVDNKLKDYAPHGRLLPRAAPSGSVVSIHAFHVSMWGMPYRSVPNGCVVP